MNQFLIAANSKRGQLIFNIFKPIDLLIIGSGALVTFLLLIIVQPQTFGIGLLVLLPLLICGFLVIPIPNYHNMRCFLTNIYVYLFVDENELKWKGWCFKDEYHE